MSVGLFDIKLHWDWAMPGYVHMTGLDDYGNAIGVRTFYAGPLTIAKHYMRDAIPR